MDIITPNPIEIIKFQIFIFIAFAFLAILGMILGKKREGEMPAKKFLKIYVIILLIVMILMGNFDYLYLADYLFNNMAEKKIFIEQLTVNNTGYFFWEKGKKYNFGSESKQKDILDELYVGNVCKLKYYKWSGYVTNIKLLE